MLREHRTMCRLPVRDGPEGIDVMTQTTFRKVFSQFLVNYWGAFHEVLEAQSVTPDRLAGSLFNALQAEHRAFDALYVGSEKSALVGLGHIWSDVEARRYRRPDPALTHDEIVKALQLFREIYDSLFHQGEKYLAARTSILEGAPHGTPRERLRADAAR